MRLDRDGIAQELDVLGSEVLPGSGLLSTPALLLALYREAKPGVLRTPAQACTLPKAAPQDPVMGLPSTLVVNANSPAPSLITQGQGQWDCDPSLTLAGP